MPKIEISKTGNSWRVAIDDGPNLAAAIVDGGVRVEIPPYSESPSPLVHLTFRADELTLNLPDAIVQAVRELAPTSPEREA